MAPSVAHAAPAALDLLGRRLRRAVRLRFLRRGRRRRLLLLARREQLRVLLLPALLGALLSGSLSLEDEGSLPLCSGEFICFLLWSLVVWHGQTPFRTGQLYPSRSG